MTSDHNISKPNRLFIPEVGQLLKQGRTVTFRVHGRSMRPFLDNGRDQVILTRPTAEVLRRGDVVLAEIGPYHYVLHRIIRRDGDRLTLKGDGNPYQIEHCTTSDVIGIATGFLRKGRTTPDLVNGYKWRIYSSIWMALDPFRRYLLAIYRHTFLKIGI